MLYTMQVDNGGSTYADRVRWPKYSGTQNVYTLGYNDSGRLLKRRLPTWTKDDHLHEAESLLAGADRQEDAYRKHIDREMKILDGEGISPGPLISGIVSDKFPARVKDDLRRLAHHISQMRGAAAAHFAAAGKRLDTFRAKIRG